MNHWTIVKTVLNSSEPDDPEVLNIFETREHAIGELLKIYIKYNINLISKTKLEENIKKYHKRILDGDTNDIIIDKYKYTITGSKLNRFAYFDDEIVSIYNKLK